MEMPYEGRRASRLGCDLAQGADPVRCTVSRGRVRAYEPRVVLLPHEVPCLADASRTVVDDRHHVAAREQGVGSFDNRFEVGPFADVKNNLRADRGVVARSGGRGTQRRKQQRTFPAGCFVQNRSSRRSSLGFAVR